MPHISVVIPMYNEERYIARCLDTLRTDFQTFHDFEVILIDDGSTDRTVEIASRYDVRILRQEHGGPWKARNWGAKEATGDILVFVDADMYFDAHFLEKLVRPIIDGDEIGTIHGTEHVWNLENPMARAWSVIRAKYDPNMPRYGAYRAIVKKVFLDFGGFDASKGYFDDEIGGVNNGKWALAIEDAICYHNNPETVLECYHHSIWVGGSLLQTPAFQAYLLIYRYWVLAALLLSLLFLILSIRTGSLIYLPIMVLGGVLVLIYVKAIQRTVREGYASHLVYIPVVMIARWLWYIVGMAQFILLKK